MWIAELLDNSWSETVSSKMSAYDEETKGDGILTFYIFLREYVSFSKKALILAEQQLTKEKLALDNLIMIFTNSPAMPELTSNKASMLDLPLPINILS